MSLVGADGYLIEPTILGEGEQGPLGRGGVRRSSSLIERKAEVLLGAVTVHGSGRTTPSRKLLYRPS